MSTRIVRGCLETGDDDRIEWGRLCSRAPHQIIFAPPLIGGGLPYHLRLLRPLVHHGIDIVSFNYAGHGATTGKFTLKRALTDTARILDMVGQLGRKKGLPVVGLASCFGSIPLLHAACSADHSLDKMVFINWITEITPFPAIKSFVKFYCGMRSDTRDRKSLIAGLRRYTETLFPDIDKNGHTFGSLSRHRTDFLSLIVNSVNFRPLKRALLPDMPACCLYSGQDQIRSSLTGKAEHIYVKELRQILPKAVFYRLQGDHFLSQPHSRQQTLDLIVNFIAR